MFGICGLVMVASTPTSFSGSARTDDEAVGATSGSDTAFPRNEEPASEPDAAAGEAQMKALAESYPSIIRDVMYRAGDWAVRIDDEWYYWADGRLLPEDLRQDADQYVGIRFYNYELGALQERPEVSPEQEARLRERTSAITSDSDDGLRFNDFLDTLYGVTSFAEAERTMHSVQFLGKWIRVHPILVAPLEQIEVQIRQIMIEDQRVRAYVTGREWC